MGVFLLMQPTLLFTIICHALCATLKSSSSCFHLVPLFKRHPMFTPITESSLQPPILILKVFAPHFCYNVLCDYVKFLKKTSLLLFFALKKATTFIFTLTLTQRLNSTSKCSTISNFSFQMFYPFQKNKKKTSNNSVY